MGHKYTLVMISVAKKCLRGEMTPDVRLKFLGYLEKFTDNVLTPEIIALVEPIDEKGSELYQEAMKLGFGMKSPNAFNILDQKFDVLATLNPSLKLAYDEACRPWTRVA